jgi:Rrf2 family protein
MICLSQTTGYAIHALSRMSPERACLIREVAESTGIHKPYLAKIFNLLNNNKLVTSKRGYRGGILLARPAAAITILQIVEAVEGEAWLGHCLLGLRDCKAQHVCPTHDIWVEIKKRIHDSLRRITLAEVMRLSQKEDIGLEIRCQGLNRLLPLNIFPAPIRKSAMNEPYPHNAAL